MVVVFFRALLKCHPQRLLSGRRWFTSTTYASTLDMERTAPALCASSRILPNVIWECFMRPLNIITTRYEWIRHISFIVQAKRFCCKESSSHPSRVFTTDQRFGEKLVWCVCFSRGNVHHIRYHHLLQRSIFTLCSRALSCICSSSALEASVETRVGWPCP